MRHVPCIKSSCARSSFSILIFCFLCLFLAAHPVKAAVVIPPQLLHAYEYEEGCVAFALSGNRAVWGLSRKEALHTGGILVLDITNALDPLPLGEWRQVNAVYDLAMLGDWVYGAMHDHPFGVLDVSNPAAPVETDSLPHMPDKPFGMSLVVEGNLAYTTQIIDLRIVDVSNPSNLVVRGVYAGDCNASGDIVKRGNYVFFGNGSDSRPCTGLNILDVSDPDNPVLANRIVTDGIVSNGVAVHDEWAYVTNNLEMFVVHIGSPPYNGALEVLNSYGGAKHTILETYDNYLFAVAGGEIWIYDLSSPQSPSLAAKVALPGIGTQRLTFGNGYLWVGGTPQGKSLGRLAVYRVDDSVPVPTAMDDAVFVEHDLPEHVDPLAVIEGTVRFRNTGHVNIWSASSYSLRSVSDTPELNGLSFEYPPKDRLIPPGASVAFSVSFTAPADDAVHIMKFQMHHGSTPFGESHDISIIVGEPPQTDGSVPPLQDGGVEDSTTSTDAGSDQSIKWKGGCSCRALPGHLSAPLPWMLTLLLLVLLIGIHADQRRNQAGRR